MAADRPTPDDVLDMFRRSMNSRDLADQGIYCECDEPDVPGLMCHRCDRRNRDAELRAVHRIVDSHDFVPRNGSQPICEVCTGVEGQPRHHGIGEIGRTSWGEDVQGVSDGC